MSRNGQRCEYLYTCSDFRVVCTLIFPEPCGVGARDRPRVSQVARRATNWLCRLNRLVMHRTPSHPTPPPLSIIGLSSTTGGRNLHGDVFAFWRTVDTFVFQEGYRLIKTSVRYMMHARPREYQLPLKWEKKN